MNQYALDILSCPQGYSKTAQYVVYSSPTKLAVVQGATEITSIDLKDFAAPITSSQKTTFNLPGNSSISTLTSFDYCGLNGSGEAIFAAFFPKFSVDDASKHYLQWAYKSEINGVLKESQPDDLDGYSLNWATAVTSIRGEYIGFSSTTAYAICSGGVKLWSKQDGTKLFNTLNSKMPSNLTTSIVSDSLGNLWIGSAEGLIKMYYADSTYNFKLYDTTNTNILSSYITNLSISGNKLVLSTNKGVSVFNTETETSKNYSKLNVTTIRTNEFNAALLYNDTLVAASIEGIHVGNLTTNVWKLYDSNITGWNGSNNTSSIDIIDGIIIAGTSDSIYTFEIGQQDVTHITAAYSNIVSVIYSNNNTSGSVGDKIYAAHNNGHISVYDAVSYAIIGDIAVTTGIIRSLNKEFYFAGSNGYGNFNVSNSTFNALPGTDENADILFSYPANNQYDVSRQQTIYIGLSKPSTVNSITNHFTSDISNFHITSLDSGYMFKITPDLQLGYTETKNFKVMEGLTATDNSFFRQSADVTFTTIEKEPINGWHNMGKQLTLTGTTEYPIESITFKNPHDFDIPITALIGV